MPDRSTCPECGKSSLYKSPRAVPAGGQYGPSLLPGLGGFLRHARFTVVVCAHCGLTRFYADARARSKLSASGVTSAGWIRVR